MNAELLLKHYEQIADAPDAIARLRRFILDLAVRGKLVLQDATEEPASELLERIVKEKAQVVRTRRASHDEPAPFEEGQEPFSIPKNWSWTRLGNIADLVRGVSFPASDKAATPSKGSVPCFRSGNIQSDIVWGDFIYVPLHVLRSDQQLVREGDILISIANSYELVGKCSIIKSVELEATFGAFLAAIRLYSLSPKYILHFLSSDFSAYRFRLGSSQTTNIANITFATIRDHAVPLPPLAEQRRIVAKVEELMGLCDRLVAVRAEREAKRDRLAAASLARLNVPDPDTFQADVSFVLNALPALTSRSDQIKALRQTILNLAASGKLVPQDPNEEPASELLKRIAKEQQARMKSRRSGLAPRTPTETSLPTGWANAAMSELAIFENGDRSSSYPSGTDIIESGIAFFNTKNLSGYKLHFKDLDYISEKKFASLRSGKLQDLDILVTLRGSVGKFGLFKASEEIQTGFINAQLLIVRSLLPEFVDFFLTFMKSDAFSTQLDTRASGSATPQLSAGQLAQVVIPVPPLAEQRRIVAKIDELMGLCDRLEASLSATGATRRRLLDALLAVALEPADDLDLEAAE